MELAPEHYAAVFAGFAKAPTGAFEQRADGHHVLVKFEDRVYRISHSADLEADYRDWFTYGHDLLFTELPAGLWDDFFDHLDPFLDNFLIDLYEGWKSYWQRQAAIYERTEQYPVSMDKAHTHFELLCEKLRKQDGRPVELAWEIDDLQLLPVVALAVKRHYGNDHGFYRVCAAWMTSKYQDQLGDGQLFAAFLVPVPGEDEPQAFFIYSVDEPLVL